MDVTDNTFLNIGLLDVTVKITTLFLWARCILVATISRRFFASFFSDTHVNPRLFAC